MGFFKKLFGTVKDNKPQYTNNLKVHCGVCGMTLNPNDWICMACGGPPVCDKCLSEIVDGKCQRCEKEQSINKSL
jgi:hypothetical protein